MTLLGQYGDVEDTTTLSLPARGHVAKFVQELFSEVGDGYSGLMEIRSTSPIVPITLKLTINSRNDVILTTLPVTDLTQPVTATSLVFLQALGNGFATYLILVNTNTMTGGQWQHNVPSIRRNATGGADGRNIGRRGFMYASR